MQSEENIFLFNFNFAKVVIVSSTPSCHGPLIQKLHYNEFMVPAHLVMDFMYSTMPKPLLFLLAQPIIFSWIPLLLPKIKQSGLM